MGAFDGRLAETPEAGERSRELQAPNRASTWAKNQAPREEAMTGPRFEQTIMELQVGFSLSGSIERLKKGALQPPIGPDHP
jgi:hypothetical protein